MKITVEVTLKEDRNNFLKELSAFLEEDDQVTEYEFYEQNPIDVNYDI